MNKQNVLIFLLLVLLLSCQESKRNNFSMEMPDTDTMSSIFAVEKGLSSDLKDEKIVFEKYIKTMSWDIIAYRIYANGDYYYIYDKDNKDNNAWEKLGVISQKGIKKIQKISNTSVIDFILAEPDLNHMGDSAMQNIEWYFYFDQPKFAETQVRMFKWQWWVQPQFVKQMDRTIRRYLTRKKIVIGSGSKAEEACD